MPELPEVEIRKCREDDLGLLEQYLPEHGYHNIRLDGQKSGKNTYLTAWADKHPVGNLYITWGGASEDQVRQYDDSPSVSSFNIAPNMRGQKIGTRLMAAAEKLIKSKGYSAVGLGVSVNNAGALRLYKRLGYKDWGHGTYQASWRKRAGDDASPLIVEECRRLVKEL